MSKEREALKLALEALKHMCHYTSAQTGYKGQIVADAMSAIDKALAQPEQRYRRGDRLVCLETDEYCVIHISGTDRQWVKFPDTQIGVYTNEQVDKLFGKLAKETDLAQPEQEPVAWADHGVVNWIADKKFEHAALLYERPQRTWVGLTRRERFEIEKAMSKYYDYQHECKTVCLPEFAAAIEAKLKEKNT